MRLNKNKKIEAMNIILYLLIILTLVAFSSCKKDVNSSPTQGVVQIGTSGTCRINNFVESIENKTADFASYEFCFNSNGQLIAVILGVNTTGIRGWEDSSSKFHISIGNIKPTSELTDDWLIHEKTETLIGLNNDAPTKNEFQIWPGIDESSNHLF